MTHRHRVKTISHSNHLRDHFGESAEMVGSETMPDCGDNSCRYATNKGGMRTNGGCSCDECPECGVSIRPPFKHRTWCKQRGWIPEHVADAILKDAGIDADKELKRAMDSVARHEEQRR